MGRLTRKRLTPPPSPPHPSVYLDSIFFLLCMWRNSAVTYVLTRLKNNIVATGSSKKLVATVLGWNQSLIATMYLYNNNNNNTLGPWPNVTKAAIISILKLKGFSYPCHAMAKDKGKGLFITLFRMRYCITIIILILIRIIILILKW